MSVLLYTGLARGPVSVVASIVAVHPALVVIVAVALGSRPSPAAWGAMALVLAGGLLIAWLAEPDATGGERGRAELDRTLLIALGACLAYVLLVLSGQWAAAELGELQTAWLGRLTGLAAAVALMLSGGSRPGAASRMWPLLLAQGAADTTGYLALAAGGRTEAPEITAVVGSGFSMVTIVLGFIVLKEAIGWRQWVAILMIAAGTVVLAIE